MRKRVEFLKCGCGQDKKVTDMGKDREDGAKYKFSIAPGGEAYTSFTELSDSGEGSLGKRQPSLEVDR